MLTTCKSWRPNCIGVTLLLKARANRPVKMFSIDRSTVPFAIYIGYLRSLLGWWQRLDSVMFSLARVAKWQTRWLQVPVFERTWGFKSPLAHESDGRLPHALIAPTYRPFATSTDEEFPAVVQFVRWRTAICRNRGTRMM